MKSLLTTTMLLLVVGIGTSSTTSRFAFDSSSDIRYSHSKKIARRIKIENLYFDADEDQPQTLTVKTFSVFNLVSGRIETTVGSQTEIHGADDFWTAKARSRVGIKALGDGAILRVFQVK